MSTALDFTYRYEHASGLGDLRGGHGLALATCGAAQEHPHFFEGRLRQPREVGEGLLALSEVVRTHYWRPMPANLDPVVTSHEGMLRFEGFSGCCGVYARVDLPEQAFDSEVLGRGTTNVDFNEPMRAALMRMGEGDEVQLAVGPEEVSLTRGEDSVVEKKVKLPLRWIKAFSEVQAYQPRMELRLEVSGADARRFVRSLPTTAAPKRPSFVVQSGKSLRLSQREARGAVRVTGVQRLRVLERLVATADRLRIWADEASQVSAWEVSSESSRVMLLLSPELHRGFSGEGQVLETLATGDWEDSLAKVRAQLRWQAEIETADLGAAAGVDSEQAEAALTALGTRGLVGFDACSGRFFHRELPFDLEAVETMQPRLKNARALLEAGGLRLENDRDGESADVSVPGTDVRHFVRLRPDGDACSCPWYGKHRGARGPCKHVLAARLWLEDGDQV